MHDAATSSVDSAVDRCTYFCGWALTAASCHAIRFTSLQLSEPEPRAVLEKFQAGMTTF